MWPISHCPGSAGSMDLISISSERRAPSPGLCACRSPRLIPVGSQLRVLCFPGKPSLTAYLSSLEEAFTGLRRLPCPLRPCFLHHHPIPLVWCQVCLPPGLLVATVSLASHSSGLGTENLNEV